MEDTCIKGLISYSGNRPNNEKKESQVVNKLQPKFSVLMVGYIMTWFDLINKGKKTSTVAIALVNDIMADGEIRSINELLDEMFNKVKRKRDDRTMKPKYLTGRNSIPTREELKAYLGNSRVYGLNMPEYDSGIFDRDTGAPSANSRGNKVHFNTVRKYWLKK